MVKIKKFILKIGYNMYKSMVSGFLPYIILLLISNNIYGQSTEKSQKQQKVIEKREQPQSSTPTTSNPPSNTILTPRVRTYRPYYYHPQQWGYNPYWNPYRSWDGRTYILTNDTSNLSPIPPLRFSLGVLSEVTTQNPNTLSPYLTIGRKNFLLLQYHSSLPNTIPHYNNIYRWEVEEWGDEPLGNPKEQSELVIALGTTNRKLSPYIGMGFYTLTKWDAFFDETYTLSPYRELGMYTINEETISGINAKIGLLYGFQRGEILTQISLGQHIRFGIGIGLKL
jgi:hypothetical protein